MPGSSPFIRLPGEWKCALIRPGIASCPVASIVRANGRGHAAPASGPMAAMRPASMAMSARGHSVAASSRHSTRALRISSEPAGIGVRVTAPARTANPRPAPRRGCRRRAARARARRRKAVESKDRQAEFGFERCSQHRGRHVGAQRQDRLRPGGSHLARHRADAFERHARVRQVVGEARVCIGDHLVALGAQAGHGLGVAEVVVRGDHADAREATRLHQGIEPKHRGGGANAGARGHRLGQRAVVREADAGALAAVPHQQVGFGVRKQRGGGEQALGGVGVGRGVAGAEHRRAREVRRDLRQLAQHTERDALDHRVARGRDGADEVAVALVQRRSGGGHRCLLNNPAHAAPSARSAARTGRPAAARTSAR